LNAHNIEPEGYGVYESDRFCSRLNKYLKNHPREMSNIRNTIHRTIAIHERSNKSIHQIAAGIGPVKCEFADVFRVSEQGKGAGLTPIRLYFCVNKTEKVLYLLALGPKLPRSQQQDDINYCKKERNIINSEQK
jgi:hypothetical protein